MKENNEFLGDDCIYPSNFGKELFDVVSIEELLQAPQKKMILLHVAPSERPIFTSSTMKQNLKTMKSKEESLKEGEMQTSFL